MTIFSLRKLTMNDNRNVEQIIGIAKLRERLTRIEPHDDVRVTASTMEAGLVGEAAGVLELIDKIGAWAVATSKAEVRLQCNNAGKE